MQGAGGVGGLLMVRHGGQSYVPLMDGNGNVMGLQGLGGAKDGQTVARYDYDAFGNRITNTAPELGEDVCPFGFSTKLTDGETGLMYYGYRYYSPELGRWLSRDPIEERGGINLYGMVGNDAVNRWDLLGNRPCLERFLENYIAYNCGKDGTSATFDRVGGWLDRAYDNGDPNYQNSCALRVSVALNLAGEEFEIEKGSGTTRIPDGNFPQHNQIISAKVMLDYLRSKFGNPDYKWWGQNAENAEMISDAACGGFGVVYCSTQHCGVMSGSGFDSGTLSGRDGIFGWKLRFCGNSN
jgi:RHS repeat-associated protein